VEKNLQSSNLEGSLGMTNRWYWAQQVNGQGHSDLQCKKTAINNRTWFQLLVLKLGMLVDHVK